MPFFGTPKIAKHAPKLTFWSYQKWHFRWSRNQDEIQNNDLRNTLRNTLFLVSITNLIQFLRMLSLLFTVNPKPRKSTKYNIYCRRQWKLCLCKKLVSRFRKKGSQVQCMVGLGLPIQWNLTFFHHVLSNAFSNSKEPVSGSNRQLFPYKIDFCIFTIGIYENASFPNNVEETFAKHYFEIRIDN